MKIIIGTAFLSLILLLNIVVTSRASNNPNKYSFSLPPQAREVEPGIYDLGTSFEKGEKVQGLAILHPRPEVAFGHKPNHKPGNGGSDSTPTCYTFIANGARWRETEGYYLDPTNDDYSEADVLSKFSLAAETWDSEVAFNIFGEYLGANVDEIDTSNTDGKNEIMFGSISEPNVIAVTVVWYTIGGPPWSRKIVEHDMMFDNIDFTWGNVGETSETSNVDTNIMDFLNIATHETGHSAGLGDVYEDACSEVTEYGYGQAGETKKRTLELPDITGIKELYE